MMAQCRFALKPDGLFLGAMLGGSTLQELRIACTLAQQEREGGVSPRTSPLAQVRDAGNLLTRAGLSIPTVDVDEINVHYRDVVDLVNHLRKMGETNSLIQRRESLPRDTALASAAAYTALFGEEHDDNYCDSIQSIPATYQIIYMTGWAPDPSQPKAAKRGSATVSFEDLSSAMNSKDT
jgi:NADH dehydrogenase [ubiquinone] 1 alpha subcomplex assembly factor 5